MIRGDKLGEGSYGIVYEATSPRNQTKYAVKRNLAEENVSFTSVARELDILHKLGDHPNIISIEKIHKDNPFESSCFSPLIGADRKEQRNDILHFQFKKADNDFHNYLFFNKNKLTFEDIRTFMVDILLGIEYMHSQKIIHRDIKPSNILVFTNDENLLNKPVIAKLCDFGLSKPFTYQVANTPSTVTSWYRPPEILLDNYMYDYKVDIWSVGCVLYEMVVGKPFFNVKGNDNNDNLILLTNIINELPYNNKLILDSIQELSKKITYPSIFVNKLLRSVRLKKKIKPFTSFVQKISLLLPKKTFWSSERLYQFSDLISNMLNIDWNLRYSATQCLNHPFFHPCKNLIAQTRELYPCTPLPFPIYNIVNCNERHIMHLIAKDIFNKRQTFKWYSNRTLFQALDLYDRFLYKNYSNNPNFTIDKETVTLDFFSCLYLCVKYFSSLQNTFSFLGFLPSYIKQDIHIDDHILSRLEQFELSFICDYLKYDIYRDTIYEIADMFNYKLLDHDIRNLVILYTLNHTFSSKNPYQLFTYYLNHLLNISLKSFDEYISHIIELDFSTIHLQNEQLKNPQLRKPQSQLQLQQPPQLQQPQLQQSQLQQPQLQQSQLQQPPQLKLRLKLQPQLQQQLQQQLQPQQLQPQQLQPQQLQPQQLQPQQLQPQQLQPPQLQPQQLQPPQLQPQQLQPPQLQPLQLQQLQLQPQILQPQQLQQVQKFKPLQLQPQILQQQQVQKFKPQILQQQQVQKFKPQILQPQILQPQQLQPQQLQIKLKLEEIYGLKWNNNYETLLILDNVNIKSDKVAAFDLDHTLIKPKTDNKFPIDSDDWQWLYPNIVSILKNIYNEGYKIVIFSNQAGIEKDKTLDKTLENDIKEKIIKMIKDINIPISAYISTDKDHFRKPHSLMWDILVTDYKFIKKELCYFVGDAGGRVKLGKRKKDFSCSDRSFAENCGLKYYTPEEFFLSEEYIQYECKVFNAQEFLNSITNPKFFFGSSIVKDTLEMIIFVASPASGKSTFAKKYLIPSNYTWINRDNLHTPQKCLDKTRESLLNNRSVVIDNTNPNIEARQEYIKIANEIGCPVRCFLFDMDRSLSEHLSFYREALSYKKHKESPENTIVKRIPDIEFNTYYSKFTKPTLNEGFTEICDIKFIPEFNTYEEEKLFLQKSE